MIFLKKYFSTTVLILIVVVYSVLSFRTNMNPISYDGIGYYTYLPQTFIQGNIRMTSLDETQALLVKHKLVPLELYQYNRTKQGYFTSRYSIGLALLQSPFFLTAHLYTLLTGGEADGYSANYQLFLKVSHLFYIFMGFYFLRKILRTWHSDVVTGMTLLFTGFFTTILLQSYVGSGMTHGPLFGVQMAVVYLTLKWHQTRSRKDFFLLGFMLALAAVCRPTEIILVLIPLLWEVYSMSTFRIKLFALFAEKRNWQHFFYGFFLAIFPQFFWWWYTTGSPIYYSYQNPGEGFEFIYSPVLKSLFHPRSGVFIYSPILLVGIIGYFLIKKENKKIFLSLLIFTVVYFYVLGSWSVEWYGFRSFTQCYGIPAIGLASVIKWQTTNSMIKKISVSIFVLFFSVVTWIQFYQFANYSIDPIRMTWKYYLSIFGKLNPSPELKNLMLVDRGAVKLDDPNFLSQYEATNKVIREGFENKNEDYITEALSKEGRKCNFLNKEMPYSKAIEIPFAELTNEDHSILKISFWYTITTPMDSVKLSSVAQFSHEAKSYNYVCKELERITSGAKPGQWQYYEFFYLTPEVRRKSDKFSFFIWMRGNGVANVDNLEVSVYERKFK